MATALAAGLGALLSISCSQPGTQGVAATPRAAPVGTVALAATGSNPVAVNGALKVCGSHICNANGQQIQLRGMSLFWSNTGWNAERFFNSTLVNNQVDTWNASVIRAPLGVEGDGGYLGVATTKGGGADSSNMTRVKAVVDAAIARGVYVIVDWHYSSANVYQSQAQSFFQQMAQTYAGKPNIIWEIYNEPTTNSWDSLKSYAQAVISTIRSAGSTNLVVVGTPNWSQDVDTAANNPITSDNNVAYTLHFYAGSHTQWLRDKANTAMSKGLALFVTEWGTCNASGNGGFTQSESSNWTSWMDQNKISSCNWSMNDKAETASALVSGGSASSTGPWADSQLTQSGSFARSYIMAGSSFIGGGGGGGTPGGGGGGNPQTCTQAPSTPGNVNASGQSSSTIQVSWSAVSAPSYCSVTYNVLRGGNTIVSGLTSTSFTDSGLAASTAYSYTVVAVDAAGTSSASYAASAMTAARVDSQAPSTPSNVNVSSVGTTSVGLTWSASTDDTGVVGYTIYSSGQAVGTSTSTYAQVGNLNPSTVYTFSVKAYDAAGNYSAASGAVAVSTSSVGGGGGGGGGPDITPPSVPSNLTWNASDMTVTLSWGSSTDNVGVVGYQLYYGSFYLGLFSDTSLALIGFKTGTPYVFTVKAVDAAGNVSQASNQATVLIGNNTVDTIPPSAPSNLTVTSIGSTSVSLRWSASSDNVGVVIYQIFAGTASVGMVPSATSGTVNNLTAGTSYTFTVKAADAAGNVSQASNSITVTTTGSTVDTTPPSTPSGIYASGITSSSITLAWSASTDNVGVAAYDVYSSSVLTAATAGTSIMLGGLSPNTTYYLTVKARDAAGNSSSASTQFAVTTSGSVGGGGGGGIIGGGGGGGGVIGGGGGGGGTVVSSPCSGTGCFRVNSSGQITKDGTVFPVHCGAWFGLQGRYEIPSDSSNPRGAPMELYIGNTFWAKGGAGTGRTIASDAKEMVAQGINVIRFPVVHQTLSSTDPQGMSPYLKNFSSVRVANSRLALEQFITTAAQNNLYVMLDIHSCSNYVDWRKGRLDARPPWVDSTRENYDYKREDCSCASDGNPSTVTRIQAYNETIWLQDLKTLAGLSKQLGVNNIIGIDLYNEPWDYSWQEWKTLVEHAYTAIDSVNPNLLLFVQGISASNGHQDGTPDTTTATPYGSKATNPNWGENLYEAGTNPPAVPKERLVYSPHTYGPSVAVQPQFLDPSNSACAGLEGDAAAKAKCEIVINSTLLKQGWEEHFGYLKQLGYAIVVGEWGGNLDWPKGKTSTRDQQMWGYLKTQSPGVDQQWQSAFASYMASKKIESCYWSINPESGDTGGLYDTPYDPVSNTGGWGEWTSFNSTRMGLLKQSWGN